MGVAPDPAVREAGLCRYPLGTGNAGVMFLTFGDDGSFWFGEMVNDRLSRLDPRTGALARWTIPAGRVGIMSVVPDACGDVWFMEQDANYIGRFSPATQRFTTYPLDAIDGRDASPEDLQFDMQGRLWFTEQFPGRIGRLDPATGAVRTWLVLDPRDREAPRPFSLHVTRGGRVWFGAALRGGLVGELDPESGRVTLHRLALVPAPDPEANYSGLPNVVAMTEDARGTIWFTEPEVNRLGRIDPASGAVTEVALPPPSEARGDDWRDTAR